MQNQPNPGGMPAPAPTPTPAPAAPTNTYGARAILASVIGLIITLISSIVLQKVLIYFALLGLYGIYAGIRGIITAMRMKGRGLATSIIGLIISLVAVAYTVWLFTP